MYPKDNITKVIEEVLRQHYNAGIFNSSNTNLGEFLTDNLEDIYEWSKNTVNYNKSDGTASQRDTNKRWALEERIIKGIYEAVLKDLDFVRKENDDLIADTLKDLS